MTWEKISIASSLIKAQIDGILASDKEEAVRIVKAEVEASTKEMLGAKDWDAFVENSLDHMKMLKGIVELMEGHIDLENGTMIEASFFTSVLNSIQLAIVNPGMLPSVCMAQASILSGGRVMFASEEVESVDKEFGIDPTRITKVGNA